MMVKFCLRIPKPVAAFAAGLLLPLGLIVCGLVLAQAVVGGWWVGEALGSGALSPGGCLLLIVAMAVSLSRHAIGVVRDLRALVRINVA